MNRDHTSIDAVLNCTHRYVEYKIQLQRVYDVCFSASMKTQMAIWNDRKISISSIRKQGLRLSFQSEIRTIFF